jgi:mannose-6-phosphate isomerase-like protein (cupin superfamily)
VRRLRVSDTLNPIKHEEEVVMKVVTLEGLPNVPMEGAEPIEGYTGPVSRSRQTIIQPGESDNYNCSVVNFSQGCTTGWHTHNCDQVLVVTSGSGMVATGMNSVRSMSVMSCTSRRVNAIGMAPGPIRRWGISRSHSSAVSRSTLRIFRADAANQWQDAVAAA